jgi:hypothetical protein
MNQLGVSGGDLLPFPHTGSRSNVFFLVYLFIPLEYFVHYGFQGVRLDNCRRNKWIEEQL